MLYHVSEDGSDLPTLHVEYDLGVPGVFEHPEENAPVLEFHWRVPVLMRSTVSLREMPLFQEFHLEGAGFDALHRIAVGVVRRRVQQEGDVEAGPPGMLWVRKDAEIRVGRDQAELEEVLPLQ
jgi:hypothetical protein